MSDIDGPLSAFALCWKIERADGAGLALTSHDRDLPLADARYRAAPGMMPSAIIRGSGLDAETGDVEGSLTSRALTEDDLVAGRWNGARVSLIAADWSNPAASPIGLVTGELGEVRLQGGQFSAEVLGAASRLDAPACPETSPQCRAEFGDRSCRVDLAGRTVRAQVIAAAGTQLTLDRALDDRFLFGRLRWLSGPPAGIDGLVLAVSGASLTLQEAVRAAIAVPAWVELREGCDKLFATCSGRFANAGNFRGEPHLPGNDLLTRYPGANG